MATKFIVGDLVHIYNLPQEIDSPIWPKPEGGPFVGIVVDIINYSTGLFKECIAIEIESGEIVTLSPNLVELVRRQETIAQGY